VLERWARGKDPPNEGGGEGGKEGGRKGGRDVPVLFVSLCVEEAECPKGGPVVRVGLQGGKR